MKRGFSPDAGWLSGAAPVELNAYIWNYADPVMAEYITIMIINNKTPGTSKFRYGRSCIDTFCHYSSDNLRT